MCRYGYKDDALCTECEGNLAKGFAPLIIAVVVIVLAMLTCCAVRKQANGTQLQGDKMCSNITKKAARAVEDSRPMFKILISLYQIIGGIRDTFGIPFPHIYQQIVSSLNIILSIGLPNLIPLDCFLSTNFNSRLVFKTVWPLVAYAILYLLSKVFRIAKKERHADRCIDSLFFIMYIMYASISNVLFSMFYCVPLEDSTSWLRVDLSIQCTDTSGATIGDHAIMQAFAAIMLIVHIVGTPATYAYLLFWKHKSAFEGLAEQELRNEHKAGLEATPQYTAQYKVLLETDKPLLEKSAMLPGYMQKLSGGYRDRAYWYELFETIRKVLLVGIPATFPERGETAQLFWGLLVTCLTGTVLTLFSPYTNSRNNLLAQFAQLQVFLTLLSSLALRATPPSKVVGDMVTVILIAVPLAAVYFETMLFDWTLQLCVSTHRASSNTLIKLFSPRPKASPQVTSARGSHTTPDVP